MTSSLTTESSIALAIVALFVVALFHSAWKAVQGGPERMYWRICAVCNWGAVAGLIAFDAQPVTIDVDGALHEQFALLAVSLIVASIGSLMTTIGVANAIYRRTTRERPDDAT